MIITGYPCIGKSSIDVSANPFIVIDFDSGYFKNYDSVDPNWHKIYVDQARDLLRQGFVVLISSNRLVLSRLAELNEPFAMVFPGLELEEEMIERATNRFNLDSSPVNHRALRRIVDHYREDIKMLMNTPCRAQYILKDTDYSLAEVLCELVDTVNGFSKDPKWGILTLSEV